MTFDEYMKRVADLQYSLINLENEVRNGFESRVCKAIFGDHGCEDVDPNIIDAQYEEIE